MAPQGAPHKRGGTHRVKFEDRTNTIYDEWDYKQLKNGCIEHGVYVKDLKKVEMAKALVKFDVEKRRAERSAVIEHEKKQRMLELEKRKENEQRLEEEAAKHRRRIQKEARRERDESVSDDTPDEEEIQQMQDMMVEGDEGPAGQALNEESWDSTSTETTIRSTNSTVLPECKLRLFEWSFTGLPSPTTRSPPSSAISPVGPRSSSPKSHERRPLPIPHDIPYAPLKVHTTESKEKLFLPGQTYPPGVNPDFVPILSRRTRHAARNGVLEGVLRKATIERATAWTNRTQIQGWNARIFFSLAPRNKAKVLQDVYNKWFLENRKLLRVEPRGDGLKVTRAQRHIQRHTNKGNKLAEILEASEYRPTAVCYLPAYLDYRIDKTEVERKLQNDRRTLETLFFIRFPGCDVPHYYFWTRKRQWADPTVSNPDWTPDMVTSDTMSSDGEDTSFERPRVSQKCLPGTAPPVRTIFTRVKNAAHAPPPPSRTTSPPDLATIVSLIECELYSHGLSMTLIKYRNRWLKKGKADAWNAFGRYLPRLYPSGTLPTTPPLKAESVVSVAMKLASIERLGDKTPPTPLTGDEPWTQNDDAWWDVREVDLDSSEDIPMPLLMGVTSKSDYSSDELDNIDPKDLEVLYRRGSIPALSFLSTDKCASWLETVSPSLVSLAPDSLPPSPTLDETDTRVREEWEKKFLQDPPRGLSVTCPFCVLELGSMNIENRAEHMHSHSFLGRASHRRASSIEFSVLPPVGRRRSCRANTRLHNFDIGADADNEKTPTTNRFRLGSSSTSKKHRSSQITHEFNNSSGFWRIPFSYLPPARGNPKATRTSRKRRHSSRDLLDEYANKEFETCVNETEAVVNKFAPGLQVNGYLTMPDTLGRRGSKMLDPTFQPSTTLSKNATKKRRKLADPTYRGTLASADSLSEEPEAGVTIEEEE